MRFKDTQKVAGLDRNMLAHVAHQSTRISCFSANRSNFAPWRLDFSPASSQITTAFCNPPRFSRIAQEVLDGRRLVKSFISQHPCRRRRWSDGEDGVPGFTQSTFHFPQRRSFSGSRHATKTENSILYAENRGNGLLLFLGEVRRWNKTAVQRRAGVPRVINVFDCPLFESQALPRAAFRAEPIFQRIRQANESKFSIRGGLLQPVENQRSERLVESFGKNLVFAQDAAPLKEMRDTGAKRLTLLTI